MGVHRNSEGAIVRELLEGWRDEVLAHRVTAHRYPGSEEGLTANAKAEALDQAIEDALAFFPHLRAGLKAN